jgi:hypothetical protein
LTDMCGPQRAPPPPNVPALTAFASGDHGNTVETPLGVRQATHLERGVELLLRTPPVRTYSEKDKSHYIKRLVV